MATEVNALSREIHHAEHILPTWKKLPARLRGTFYAHPSMRERLAELGVEAASVDDAPNPGPLTLVASYRDLKLARKLGRRVIYSEHGAGQSYSGAASGSYIGSTDRAGVVGVLVPGKLAAEKHSVVHPTIPAFQVGVPKLDALHAAGAPAEGSVVAISFHWDCRVCPETRSAFRFYKDSLRSLARKFTLIGHAHPRVYDQIAKRYKQAGIEAVQSFEEVIERASVYCVDNSSTLYEWASLDRPVVVMNCPLYRRNVDHGLRFWSHADVGPVVDRSAQLPAAIERALEDPAEDAERRQEIVRDVYVACDGKATQRAADAVKTLAKEWG